MVNARAAALMLVLLGIVTGPCATHGSPGAPAAPLATRIEGRVARVTADRVTLVTREGATVTVDISAVARGTRQLLFPGRDVEVFGVTLPSGLVWARGVTLDYGDAVSASPR